MALIVDSSGWLQYFLDGPLADAYEEYLRQPELLVPAIVLYEVGKILLMRVEEMKAADALGLMADKDVIAVDEEIALAAAHISLQYKLAMADAIIYATAQHYQAQLVTSDAHFASLPDVCYLPLP